MICMIDATLDKPFFRRNPDGSVTYPSEAGFVDEFGALEALPEGLDWGSDDDDDDEEEFGLYETDGDDSDGDSTARIQCNKADKKTYARNRDMAMLQDATVAPQQVTHEQRNVQVAREIGAEAAGKLANARF
jgi:hypothetical protein